MDPPPLTPQTPALQRITRLAAQLREAERPIRILRTLIWPPEVRERFFARGERELPEVVYDPPVVAPALAAIDEVRTALDPDRSLIDRWLDRQAEAIATSARMLASLGTPAFYRLSAVLYGTPTSPLAGQTSTALELARLLDDVLSDLTPRDLGLLEPLCHDSASLAAEMRVALERGFGANAPAVVIVDHLSANAVAEQGTIKIRRSARFTDRDARQLLYHEAYVHAATTWNGQQQSALPILAAGHAGTTRTQEGLAVLSEFLSGAMDPDRLRRLADRVLAIQMAIDGADFLDVYRFYLGRIGEREQAFENTRRVFRGGVLAGGAPFTKDVVYLDGLLRVHNFLRAAVLAERSDCLHLLFCGKLDLGDIPALGHLAELGLCRPPRFLPPWAADLRFLVSYLAYSAFFFQVDLAKVNAHFAELLAQTPRFPAEARSFVAADRSSG